MGFMLGQSVLCIFYHSVMSFSPDLIVGIVGMALILLAFLFNQVNIWKNDDIVYDIANFLGSAGLVYYAWIGHAIPFIVLNTVWAFFSLRDIFIDMGDLYQGRKKFYFYHFSR